MSDLRQLGQCLLLVDVLVAVEVPEPGAVEPDPEVGAEDALAAEPVDALESLVEVGVDVSQLLEVPAGLSDGDRCLVDLGEN